MTIVGREGADAFADGDLISVCLSYLGSAFPRVPGSHIHRTRQALCILTPEQVLQGNSVSLLKCAYTCQTTELGFAFGKRQSKEPRPIASRINILVKRKVLFSC